MVNEFPFVGLVTVNVIELDPPADCIIMFAAPWRALPPSVVFIRLAVNGLVPDEMVRNAFSVCPESMSVFVNMNDAVGAVFTVGLTVPDFTDTAVVALSVTW